MSDVKSLIDSLKKTRIPKNSKICIDEVYIQKAMDNSAEIKTIIIAQDPYPADPMDIPVFLEKIEDILDKRIGRLVFKEILRSTFTIKIFKENFPDLDKKLKDFLPPKIVKNNRNFLKDKAVYEFGYEEFLINLSEVFPKIQKFAYYLLETHGILLLNSRYWADTNKSNFTKCIESDNLNVEVFKEIIAKNNTSNISIYCIGVPANERLRYILKQVKKDMSLSLLTNEITNAIAIKDLPKFKESQSQELKFYKATLKIYCIQYPK